MHGHKHMEAINRPINAHLVVQNSTVIPVPTSKRMDPLALLSLLYSRGQKSRLKHTEHPTTLPVLYFFLSLNQCLYGRLYMIILMN